MKLNRAEHFLQAEAVGSSRRWLCWGEGDLSLRAFPPPDVPGVAAPPASAAAVPRALLSSGAWELSSAWQRRKIPVGGL